MNIFTNFPVEVSAAFAQGMVNFLLQSTAMILAGLIAASLLRKQGSAVQSAIYRGTLVAVFICPLASLTLNGMGFRGWTFRLPEIAAAIESPETSPSITSTNRTPTSTDSIEPSHPILIDLPMKQATENISVESIESQSKFVTETEQAERSAAASALSSPNISPTSEATNETATSVPLIAVYFVAVTAWVVGALWMLIRLSIAWWQLLKMRRQSILADENELAICSDLAKRIRVVPPQVLRNPQLSSPCLTGVSSPAILLPAGIQDRFLLEKAFAHELAHLLRRDNLWNLAQRVSLALFFFQQLIWWLVRRLETTAEEVCDDSVVSHCADRTGYAQQLVELAESSHTVPGLAGIGMFQCKSVLGRRVVRILDSTRQLTTGVSRSTKTSIGTAAIACAILGGLVGSGNNSLSVAGPTAGDPSNLEDIGKEDSSERVIEFSGRVLDRTGQPVAGADIAITPLGVTNQSGLEMAPYLNTETDAEGAFAASIQWSSMLPSNYSLAREKNFNIFASKSGHGMNWISSRELQPKIADSGNHLYESIELKLTETKTPIELRLIDAEGNPVRDASAVVVDLVRFPSENISGFYQSIEQGLSQAAHFTGAEFANYKLTEAILSSENGKLKVDELGDNRIVTLKITGPSITARMIKVATIDRAAVTVSSGDMVNLSTTYYGAKSTITCEPSQPIIGRVVDAETKQPMSGVTVHSLKFAGEILSGTGMVKTASDEKGRFELRGMPRGEGNEIVIVPSDDQPNFMMRYEVPSKAGLEPVEMQIELPRGIWIEGRVTDATTKQPVSGARIYFIPFLSNEIAAKSPAYGDDQYLVIQDRYLTGPDGSYKTVGLPGKAILGIQTVNDQYPAGMGWDEIDDAEKLSSPDGRPKTFESFPIPPSSMWPNAMKQIEIAETETTHQVDFELSRGLSIPIRLVDSNNDPLTNVDSIGLQSSTGDYYSCRESNVEATGFQADEKRLVVFYHEEKRISTVITLDAAKLIKADEAAKPLTVKLLPNATVTGQIVDAVGDPVSGQSVVFIVGGGRDFATRLGGASTDKNGRFVFDRVWPGTFYDIQLESMEYRYSIAKHLDASAAENIDLGTIDVSVEERPEPKRTLGGAESNAQSNNEAASKQQSPPGAADETVAFTGTVVDLAGKPVSEATVSLRDFRASSDANGLFKLDVAKSMIDSMSSTRVYLEAFKQGYGKTYLESNVDQRNDLRLELADDVHPVAGKIIDSEGNPVEGAIVKIEGIQFFPGLNLKELLSDSRLRESKQEWLPRGLGVVDDRIEPVRSSADGSFVIHNIGAGRLVNLSVVGERVALQKIVVATAGVESVVHANLYTGLNTGEGKIHGCNLTIIAEPTQPIEGVVIDRDTKQPLSGVDVMSDGFLNNGPMVFFGMNDLKTRTDEQGRFRLVGMPKGNGNSIMVGTPRDSQLAVPVIAQRFDVSEAAGLDPIKMELPVQRGVWIRGKAVDAETGEPIPSANFQYRPLPGNVIASKMEPDQLLVDRNWGPQTNTEGMVQLVAVPGPAAVGMIVHDPKYPAGQGWDEFPKALKAIESSRENPGFVVPVPMAKWTVLQSVDVPENGLDDLIFKVRRGVSVKVKTVDEAKLPVSDVAVSLGRTYVQREFKTETTEFDLTGFLPGQKRTVVLEQSEKRLGAIAVVTADDDLSEQITLQRMSLVTARMLDSQGKPVQGWSLKFEAIDSNNANNAPIFPFLRGEKSDAEGLISQWIIPGQYRFSIDTAQGFSGYKKITIGSGERIELGDFDVYKKLAIHTMSGLDEDSRMEISEFEAKRSKLEPESTNNPVK